MKRDQKGMIAESQFVADAVKRNWDTCTPYSSKLVYDFAVRRCEFEGWLRVQVKWVGVKREGGRPSVDLRKSEGKPYEEGDYDFLYCYHLDVNQAWMIPWDKTKGKTEIIPEGEEYDAYKLY